MAHLKKIVKDKGTAPTELEENIARAFVELEGKAAKGDELGLEIRELYFLAAKEIEVSAERKAIVIVVPFIQLQQYRKLLNPTKSLALELEKRFGNYHVVFVAQRRILPKPSRNTKVKMQKRPRSRTVTAVHKAVLEDLVYPVDVVGKRIRVRSDASQLLKVHLDPRKQSDPQLDIEGRLDTYAVVYRQLTGKDAVFEFPVVGSA